MTKANTVAELAIAIPGSIPVFQRLRIDYCCHGAQTIDKACSEAGITTDELMTLINAEPSPGAVRSWENETLAGIITFVVDSHHAYTRQSCETLQWMSAKVADRHGANHPELITLHRFVAEIIDDLLPHMMKEEQILFPYVEQLENALAMGKDAPMPFFGSARNPVRMMMLEHETVGEKLVQIREVTNDFALPEDACTTFTAYFRLLQELEQDLHNHIHLENNILFPRCIALEENTPAMVGAEG